jgi:hypothetical protein
MEVISHWSPDLSLVLDARIKFYKDNYSDNLYGYIQSLKEFIYSKVQFRDVLHYTSGGSIRIALRSFYNFTLSPFIITNEVTHTVEKIDSNIFHQAFFCTEMDDQLFYDDCFCNAFSLTVPFVKSNLSTIKLRILHSLFFITSKKLKDLVSELSCFGYDNKDIVNTINELLLNKKALIWSDKQNIYKENQLKSKDIITITPLGKDYYNHMLSNFFYVRECFIAIQKERTFPKYESLELVHDYLNKLVEYDYKEISLFIKKKSVKKYIDLYDNTGISSILWSKLSERLESLSKSVGYNIDVKYNSFIDSQIKSILDKANAENNSPKIE